jgi:hypothetical protein
MPAERRDPEFADPAAPPAPSGLRCAPPPFRRGSFYGWIMVLAAFANHLRRLWRRRLLRGSAARIWLVEGSVAVGKANLTVANVDVRTLVCESEALRHPA